MSVKRYDIGSDTLVEVTQADWDLMDQRLKTLGKLAITPPAQRERRENWTPLKTYELTARLKLYPNPMNEKVSFIAEDREIKPYPHPNEHMYPAVPQEGLIFPQAMPNDLAAEVVRRWNEWIDARQAMKVPS